MRNYSSTATPKTLVGNVSNVATQITLNDSIGLPTPPFTLVLSPDTANEEIITVDADQSGVSAPTYKVTRGEDDTTAQSHTSGNAVKHMITARDLQEPQDHIAASENVHGIADTAFLVSLNATQTLTNKRLNSPKINEDVALTATATELNVLDGITASTAELNILDGVTTLADILIPKGTVNPFAGSSAPTGWLLCGGQAVSRTTYSGLFAVLGTSYGVGDGSTTFNLPDLRGRTIAGLDNINGTDAGRLDWANTLGTTGGAQTLPEHTHSINHDHTPFTSGDDSPDHAHNLPGYSNTLNSGANFYQFGVGNNTFGYTVSGGATARHQHSIDVPAFTGTSGATGTGTHGVMQPTMLLNYIIKF